MTGDLPARPARRLPAEWENQGGIQLTWPHAATDWAPLLDRVQPVFATLAATISQYEPVLIVAQDAEHVADISDLLSATHIRSEHLWFALASSNDSWARDHGPIIVLENDQPHVLDFRFNGWGHRYPAELDDAITRTLAQQGVFGPHASESVPLVLEGGSIESDGAGTILTTTRCLLNERRNPHLDQAGIERELQHWLGAQRVLWLQHGQLQGDDTDAHIDTLARFCSADSIAYVQCDDAGDPHHAELSRMEAELAALRQPNGAAYRLIPLPWPAAIHDAAGQRLPATYANFLILNGAVLMPTYADPADERARAQLALAFPDREIIGIDCRDIIRQGGSLHCLTMQYPAAIGFPQV